MEPWKETEGAKYGIAIYNYDGNTTHGLTLDIGDAVQIFEGCAGWYRGCCLKNKAVKGIFPASFIKLKECVVENVGTPLEIIIPSGDPVIKEVTAVLHEWVELWKKLFVENDKLKFLEMKNIMNQLIGFREKILSGTLTQELIAELKNEITSQIDFWNSQMELDLVPRVNGEAVDVDQMSVVELYKIHLQSLKESKEIKRGSTMPRSTLSIRKAHRHIVFSIKRFICTIEDSLEVFFSLFNGETGKFVSERFLMRLNKDVVPNVAETLGATKTKTLFTDLGRHTCIADLFIVSQVVRTGQMHSAQKKKLSANFRRPFACGVVNVQENLNLEDDYFGEDKAFSVPLYLCTNEGDFHNMHESIIRKLSSKYSTSSDGLSMDVSLKIFNGDREKVIKANPVWIPTDVAITRKLGFPEIIMPGDIRNDVYITLDRGEFEKGGKTAGKNIEVCVSVLTSNGTVLQDCIYPGSGCHGTTEYQSLTFHHNNFPKWNEQIKLSVPGDKFQDCHVLFLFKHCTTSITLSNVRDKPGKAFAFAFLKPLRLDGTTIVDGNHQLILYKINLLDSKNPGKYLGYPSFTANVSWIENVHMNNYLRSTKEVFFVTTLTCSTKLTQNLNLVGLLKWRQQKSKIPDVLVSLAKVPGEEIVKFLQDILDALFAILNEDTDNSGMLVFQDLILIINLLLNTKFDRFQAVLNTYIKAHFSAALAHRHIVILFNKVMVKDIDKDGFEVLNLAKALRFIFKFVMQSWALYIRTHPEQSNFEFKQSIHELFVRLNESMKRTGDSWRGAQSAILLSVSHMYQELSDVFKDEELADIFRDLFSSARSSILIVDKLNFLDVIITTSPLFHNANSRVTLMPLVLSCLHDQLLRKNELKTCANLLGNLISCLSMTKNGSVYDEVDQISQSLLEVVFQAVVTVDRSSTRAGQYVAILFALLKMMTEEHYKGYLKSFSNKKDLRDFINKAFGVFTNLLQRNIYPADWFVMKIEGNYIILCAVQSVSEALTDSFLYEDAFDYQLWNTYFHLAISFVSHEILNLDKYSEAKRVKILEKYGDMRYVMGLEIVRMWNSLGDLQSNFVPSMIAPFLEMTLVPEQELRKETLPIFYDMMEREMANSENIEKIEEEFIDKLDVFVSKKGMGDENYKELFGEILTDRVTKSSVLKDDGLSFVNSVTRLLERLLDYRKVVSSREEYRDMKMSCIVNLLNYYEEMGKQDTYLRYVQMLYDLHLSAENYVEAGFALFLHAVRLKFEDNELKAEGDYPVQTEGERKEMLYRKVIEHLDEGKLWESGIRLCSELIRLYETELFDYIKLSAMLRKQAEFFKNIVDTYRPEPVYFRVAFFGTAFPSFLRNKQFVYRGKPLEKIGEFCFRIQNQYPDAEVLRHNNPLEEAVMQSNKQYILPPKLPKQIHIQCCKVEPVSNNQSLPDSASNRILSYYQVNWVDKFKLSRPFHKGTKDKSNEFSTLWCEVTTLTIETRLPGILPWFPVVSSDSFELSPIENAINTVTSKTNEIERVVQELKDNDCESINPLSMILNGVIDAAVNGGIVNYRKAFFTTDYTGTNRLRENEVNRLKNVLHEQASALREGLVLHESRISEDLRPLHENLVMHYNNMIKDLPGESSGYILIQRKRSQSVNPSPSDNMNLSQDRRISVENDMGTLTNTAKKKLKWLLTGRRPTISYFDQDDDSNRQSVVSEGIRQSSSLLSITGHGSKGLSLSVSVPDLRMMEDAGRPRLPAKRRISKHLTEGSAFSASLSRSRVSIDSATSATSLTEIDEMDEKKLTLEDSHDAESLKSVSSSNDRAIVPRATFGDNPLVSQKVNTPPAVPPKKRQSLISLKSDDAPNLVPTFAEKKKKRQSNVFELSSTGFYKVSTVAAKKQSRSMDDLDKIGEETYFQTEDKIASETNGCGKNLVLQTDAGNEKQIEVKNMKHNDEIPPPLKPRKPIMSKAHLEDPYDSLSTISANNPACRSLMGEPFRQSPRTSPIPIYDTVDVTRFGSSASDKVGLALSRPKSYTPYDNVVLHDTNVSTNGDRHDVVSSAYQSPYDTVTLGNFGPNNSDAYDFLIDPRISIKSNNAAPGLSTPQPIGLDDNANTSPTPALPPKKDIRRTPAPRKHLSTISSSSSSLSADEQKSTSDEKLSSPSPPTKARRKHPPPVFARPTRL